MIVKILKTLSCRFDSILNDLLNLFVLLCLFSVDPDVQNLLQDLINQVHLMNSTCDNISIKLEPRHHNKIKKTKNRSKTSQRKKRRIFSSSEDDSSSSSDESIISEDNK